MESGRPLIVRDIFNGPCALSRSGYEGYQDGSFLVFPIPGPEDRVAGLLSLHNKTLPPFTEEDQEIGALLTAFCSEGLRATMAFEALLRDEKKLEKSLAEKEILLREVHHRVKNNMQIIISMMNLQRPDYRSDHDRKLIDKSIHRIQAMALAHEQLYRTEDISQINLSEYIKGIVHEVVRGTAAVGTDIQVNIDIMEAYIGLELIIPVGIIVHELIDNVLDHAFPNGSGGRVDIEGHYEGEKCILNVRDNGKGLPDDFDLNRTESLGFLLIKTLAAQIKGSIQVDRGSEAKEAGEEGQGAAFTLEFVCLHS
jgi:two-component sensor histidine kinase